MEILGIQIEIPYFVIAILFSIVVGGLMLWLQRWRVVTPSKRLTIPKLIVSVFCIGVATYYILHVVFGSGRTGWP